MDKQIIDFSTLQARKNTEKRQTEGKNVNEAIESGLTEVRKYNEASVNFRNQISKHMADYVHKTLKHVREQDISVLHPTMDVEWQYMGDEDIAFLLSTKGIEYFYFVSDEGDEYAIRLMIYENEDEDVSTIGSILFRTNATTGKEEVLRPSGEWEELPYDIENYDPRTGVYTWTEFYEEGSTKQKVIFERDDAEADLLFALSVKHDKTLTDEEYEQYREPYLNMIQMANRYDMHLGADNNGKFIIHFPELPGIAFSEKSGKWNIYQYAEVADFVDLDVMDDYLQDNYTLPVKNYKRFIGAVDNEDDICAMFEYLENMIGQFGSGEMFCLPVSNETMSFIRMDDMSPEAIDGLAVNTEEHKFTQNELKNLSRFKNWFEKMYDFS